MNLHLTKNYFLSNLSVLLLILFPRFFAEQHYNTKDLYLCGLVILSLYFILTIFVLPSEFLMTEQLVPEPAFQSTLSDSEITLGDSFRLDIVSVNNGDYADIHIVSVAFPDLTKINDIVMAVRNMLETHEEIDQSQTLMVNLNSYAPSSLDFFIYTFTKTTNWVKYHEIKQDVMIKIINIVHDHDADFAFPTRTINGFPNEFKNS